MTCIIGYNDKENKKLYMIGDSAGVASNGTDITIRKDPKVFINGEFLIGFTTSFRMGQILQNIDFPKNTSKKSDFEFMCTDFIDTVIKAFTKNKYGKLVNDEKQGGVFMVGYNGNLYTIFTDNQVAIHNKPYDSVGCCRRYALGSMASLQDSGHDIETMLTMAMDVSVEFCGGVRPPYTLKTLSYKRNEK